MIIPKQFVNTGVGSLGREDVAAPAREWRSEVMADAAFSDVINESYEVSSAINEAQIEEAFRTEYDSARVELAEFDASNAGVEAYDISDKYVRDFDDEPNVANVIADSGDVNELPKRQFKKGDVHSYRLESRIDEMIEDRRERMSPAAFKAWHEKMVPEFGRYQASYLEEQNIVRSKELRSGVEENVERLRKAGLFDEAKATLMSSTYFTPEEKEAGVKKIRLDTEFETLEGVLLRSEAGELQFAIDYLEDLDNDMEMTREDRVKYRGRLEGRLSTMAKAGEKANEEALYDSNFDLAIANRDILDWDDKNIQGASDRFYERNYQDDPGAVYYSIEATGVIPKQLSSQVKAAAFERDPDKVIAGALLYDKFSKNVPQFSARFPSEVHQRLSSAAMLHSAGMKPDSIQELLDKRGKMTPEQKRETDKEYKLSVTRGEPSRIREVMGQKVLFEADRSLAFDGVGGSDQRSNDVMTAEFATLHKAYYDLLGNDEMATQAAWKDIESTWGSSYVNAANYARMGMEPMSVMRFPPERFYPDIKDNEWGQLLDNTAEIYDDVFKESGIYGEKNGDRLLLISDDKTGAVVNGSRDFSWAIMVLDGYDQPMALLDSTGEPVRFRVNPNDLSQIRTANSQKYRDRNRPDDVDYRAKHKESVKSSEDVKKFRNDPYYFRDRASGLVE